jgi:FemAB-related protein (PEP-CTERM system-associated)
MNTVLTVDDRDAAAWDAFVASHPEATAYHQYAWRRVIEQVFRQRAHYLSARDASGALVGVLPLVQLRSRLFGNFLVSMPYVNYGGILAVDLQARRFLVEAAEALGRRLGASHVELRHTGASIDGWPTRTDKVSMRRTLPDSAATLNKQLGSSLRSQIRRPIKAGASAAHGGVDLLDEFYAVFAENMRDLGTPVYPRSLFATVLREFPQRARICVIRIGARAVAAGFTIGHRGMLEIPWASSLREFNPSSVNMLLYAQLLEQAIADGYTVFDFGRSTVDSGTYRFKRQWGAEPVQLHWHYWLRDGGAEPPRLNPDNPRYRAAISAWQHLPLGLANRLGPMIVRNLP